MRFVLVEYQTMINLPKTKTFGYDVIVLMFLNTENENNSRFSIILYYTMHIYTIT